MFHYDLVLIRLCYNIFNCRFFPLDGGAFLTASCAVIVCQSNILGNAMYADILGVFQMHW